MKEENNNNQRNGNNEVNEPAGVYQPQGPLTFEKVWQMFQETDKKFRETKEIMRKQSQDKEISFQELREIIRKQSKEADRRFKETDRMVRGVSRNIGGLNNSIGEVTEEYFLGALKRMKEFAGMKIEFGGNLHKQLNNLEAEYDAVLFGKDALIVVEVKHKLTRDDVLRFFGKSLPAFKPLFPLYSNFRVLGAVAAMTAHKAAIKLAISKGLYVITQSGQKISVLNPEGFKPKEF